jgi:hypothetical protein
MIALPYLNCGIRDSESFLDVLSKRCCLPSKTGRKQQPSERLDTVPINADQIPDNYAEGVNNRLKLANAFGVNNRLKLANAFGVNGVSAAP